MRAHTEGKYEMGKRFATVIGVAAAGVMALGAQTATAGGEPVDSTSPDIQLSGKKKQELGKVVKVKASCGDEACQAVGGGFLDGSGHPGDWRQVSKWWLGWTGHGRADLGPGETTTLELPLASKQRKVAGKVLDEGNKVRAEVSVDACATVLSDGWRCPNPIEVPGKVATATRMIRLVK